jgi:hypothetical protein
VADPLRARAAKAAAVQVPAARGVVPTARRQGDRVVYAFKVPGPPRPGGAPSARWVKVTLGPTGDVLKVVVSR